MTYIYRGVRYNPVNTETSSPAKEGVYRGVATKSTKTKARSKKASGIYRGIPWAS